MNDRYNRRKIRPYFLPVILGLGLWWLASQPAIYQAGSAAAVGLAKPFWQLGATVGEWRQNFSSFFTTRQKLSEENLNLRREINRLQALALDRERLIYDNERWRTIFNRSPDVLANPFTVARILTKDSQSPFDVIVADVGSTNTRRPIAVGDLAVNSAVTATSSSPGGIILGEIITVSSATAKIQLYSAANYQLEGLVGAERWPIEISGRGNGNFRSLVPRDLPVKVGDAVTLLIGNREYLLGFISVVEHEPVKPLKEILFRQPINLDLLIWVEIHAS